MNAHPTPTRQLSELARALRRQVDGGHSPAAKARYTLAAHCQHLARNFPHDEELWRSIAALSGVGFIPPRPEQLPSGSSREIAVELNARPLETLRAMVSGVLALPSVDKEPDQARAVLELLLIAEDEPHRAERLANQLRGQVTAAEFALWRLQIAIKSMKHQPHDLDEDTLTTSLDDLRAEEDDLLLRDGLRMVIASRLDREPAYGRAWIDSALGQRHIIGAKLAFKRRPSLTDELPGVMPLLTESANLALDDPRQNALEWTLNAALATESEGSLASISQALKALQELGSDRQDILSCIHALQAGLGLTQRPHYEAFTPSAPHILKPSPPERGWTPYFDAILTSDALEQDALAIIEAAGGHRRAAEAWLRLGATDDNALLHAWRLSNTMTQGQREALITSFKDRVSDDEVILGQSDPTMAKALWHVMEASEARDLLGLRLQAVHPDEVEMTGLVAQEGKDLDDPHSTSSRLAAAQDLLEAGRYNACSAIVASLLRRCDDEGCHDPLVAITEELMSMEQPPEGLPAACSRAMLQDTPFGSSLLAALADAPMAAYPLHVELHHAAGDKRRSDAQRVLCLRAWLGIWAATNTSPESGGLQGLMRADPLLLPLAAAQLGRLSQPIAIAARFCEHYPPATTTPKTFARALIEVAAGELPWR